MSLSEQRRLHADKLAEIQSSGKNTITSSGTSYERPIFWQGYNPKRHENLHLCEYCGEIFKNLAGLIGHIRGHKSAADRKCMRCGKVFASVYNLKKHLKNHPIDGYDCKACSAVFPDPAELLKHIETHEPSERPFICDVCGRCFRSKGVLKVHLETHSDEKRYSCKICGMRFRQLTGVYNHKVVHNATKAYKCSNCGREYVCRKSFKDHVKKCSEKLTETTTQQESEVNLSTTGNSGKPSSSQEIPPNNKKEHKCSVCGRKYLYRRPCRHHLNEFLKDIIEENASSPLTQVAETNNLQQAKEILSHILFEKKDATDLNGKVASSGVLPPVTQLTEPSIVPKTKENLSNMEETNKTDDMALDGELSSGISSPSQVIETTHVQKSNMSSSGNADDMDLQRLIEVYSLEEVQATIKEHTCSICSCTYSNSRLCKCLDSVVETTNRQKTKYTLPNMGLLVI